MTEEERFEKLTEIFSRARRRKEAESARGEACREDEAERDPGVSRVPEPGKLRVM